MLPTPSPRLPTHPITPLGISSNTDSFPVIIARAKSSVSSVGIDVHYGDGLWIYWAATGCLFFATLPFIFGCIAGRDRY